MEVKTLTGFLVIIQELQAQHPEEAFYFRGEGKVDWELRPSILRDGLIRFEAEMLTELMTQRPDEFPSLDLSISQWVLAQHHGMTTRFLDITRNPLVALFHASSVSDGYQCEDGRLHIFAVPRNLIKSFNSDSVSIIANFAKLPFRDQNMLLSDISGQENFAYQDSLRSLYQLIRGEKPYFEERIDLRDLFRVFVIEPQQSSERIRAQSGAFLASAYHQRFEREEILSFNDRIPVYAHYLPIVPSDSKETILRQLQLMNITRETLFPGLDESARAITETYRQRLRDNDSPDTDSQ